MVLWVPHYQTTHYCNHSRPRTALNGLKLFCKILHNNNCRLAECNLWNLSHHSLCLWLHPTYFYFNQNLCESLCRTGWRVAAIALTSLVAFGILTQNLKWEGVVWSKWKWRVWTIIICLELEFSVGRMCHNHSVLDGQNQVPTMYEI